MRWNGTAGKRVALDEPNEHIQSRDSVPRARQTQRQSHRLENPMKTTSNASSSALAAFREKKAVRMTRQREKKTPKNVDPGHTA
jgi:hypothetical protein